LNEARSILERLISENPKFDTGYVELVPISMKLSRRSQDVQLLISF
jgi:hypothetical protein